MKSRKKHPPFPKHVKKNYQQLLSEELMALTVLSSGLSADTPASAFQLCYISVIENNPLPSSLPYGLEGHCLQDSLGNGMIKELTIYPGLPIK